LEGFNVQELMIVESVSVPLPGMIEYYTGHCRFSGQSNALATIVQILVRTTYFTDSLRHGSGTISKLFLQFCDKVSNQPWFDIDPLSNLVPGCLDAKSELSDSFSALFRLFPQQIPHFSASTGVIFHIPYSSSVIQYFAELTPDTMANLGVIFFETRSIVMRDIPEALGDFSLYVVVNRRSKTNLHLNFRDSTGWLSIYGRDIKSASSFRQDNVSCLGYIRDLGSTNVFRTVLKYDPSQRKPITLPKPREILRAASDPITSA
jgi:hypothetical protein